MNDNESESKNSTPSPNISKNSGFRIPEIDVDDRGRTAFIRKVVIMEGEPNKLAVTGEPNDSAAPRPREFREGRRMARETLSSLRSLFAGSEPGPGLSRRAETFRTRDELEHVSLSISDLSRKIERFEKITAKWRDKEYV